MNNIFLMILAGFSFVIIVSMFFNKVVTKIGVRNISRRWGSTFLVILGSMVGTALISGSLVMSDSLDKTFENFVNEQIGEIDIVVSVESDSKQVYFATINQDEFSKIENQLDKDDVDGVLGDLRLSVAPVKIDENGKSIINAYGVELHGLDIGKLNTFGENPDKFDELEEKNGIYISQDLSDKLEATIGDNLRVDIAGQKVILKVEKIKKSAGVLGGSSIIVNNEYLSELLHVKSGSYNKIYISSVGGIIPQDYNGEKFKDEITMQLNTYTNAQVKLIYNEIKQEALDGYGLKMFSIMFMVLSTFGIFAGILLIINLYQMLASERKGEMGILRTIALTRGGLMKIFVIEGYIYSIISSIVGTFFGLGIGYALVKPLTTMFETLFNTTGTSAFKIVFAYKTSSLITAFAVGAIITIVTVLISSFKISKLNIVSAIRGTEEEKEEKSKLKRSLKTLQYIVITAIGVGMTFFSKIAEEVLTNSRDAGGENNALTNMTNGEFTNYVDLIRGYSLYIGVIISLYFISMLLQRIIKQITKIDISYITMCLASSLSIVFTTVMFKIDIISKAVSQNNGFILIFLSGAILIISFSILFIYNLSIISKIISFVFSPIKNITPTLKMALRYPAVNRNQTGLTLVMFSLIIFILIFISININMNNDMSSKMLKETFGGYQIVVNPGLYSSQESIETNLSESNQIEKFDKMQKVYITLPEYKYKDLAEAPYHGDPREIPMHNEDDYFSTTIDVLPDGFIRDKHIKLSERLDTYKDDEAVWEDVINDSSKIVLGPAFVAPGWGKQPDIQLGQKLIISDIFGNKISEFEVIGLVEATESSTSSNLYTNIIGSSKTLTGNFLEEYYDFNSNITYLVKGNDDIEGKELAMIVRKILIDENIDMVLSIEEISAISQSMINGFGLMFRGFLAFSLIVGTSGLSIILVKSVNERRQQIGMLRSLGIQKKMILFGFMLEATFITFMSLIIGVSMGIVSTYGITKIFSASMSDITFIIPWDEIGLLSVAVYFASVLFSLLPSLKAASLSPIEATNYPE